MSFHHAVVWLDHTKAQVIHFDLNGSDTEAFKTHSMHPHPHLKHGDGDEPNNSRYFNDIADALKEAAHILIVGPGIEKATFVKHLNEQVPVIAEKVKAVETVDHPSEAQLLAYARKHFLAAGGLH